MIMGSVATREAASAAPPPSAKWTDGGGGKPTVLLIESTVREIDPVQWTRAQERFHFIRYDCKDDEEFCARLRQSDGPYAHLDAILRTGWLKAGPYAQHTPFRGPAVDLYPSSLQFISCTGHGYDAADIPSLTRRGITYANTPDTCTEAVANTALYLILNTFRYFTRAEHAVREGRWKDSRQLGLRSVDPIGQVLGIVGMGDIGISIARKAALGLGMRIHYHNRRPRMDLAAAGLSADDVQYHDSLDSLLRVADCVCLACPLTPENKHMLSTTQFALAKPSGMRIVNIARGGLIDEAAMLEAVKLGQVVGVGLDVHANEPGVNPALQEDYWSTLLPHIGVCSRTSWKNFDNVAVANLEEYFYGDRSKVTAVNRVQRKG